MRLMLLRSKGESIRGQAMTPVHAGAPCWFGGHAAVELASFMCSSSSSSSCARMILAEWHLSLPVLVDAAFMAQGLSEADKMKQLVVKVNSLQDSADELRDMNRTPWGM